VLIAPAIVFSFVVTVVLRQYDPDRVPEGGIVVPIAAAALWLAGSYLLAMRRDAQRGGWWGRWIRLLRSAYWPTLAALVLLAVVFTIPIQRTTERFARENARVELQGEISYYGLDERP
jgi:hypothetical protein